MSITKVQIGPEAVFAAGACSDVFHALKVAAHSSSCRGGPSVDAEAEGQPILSSVELVAWADGALRRQDPAAADHREWVLRLRANWRTPCAKPPALREAA